MKYTKFIIILLLLTTLTTTQAFAAPSQTNPSTNPQADAPSGENVEANTETIEIDAQTPASVTGETFQGNGTVVDFTTTGSKAFYTIVDKDQQVFYLIIDMDKTQNNVYFLTDITRGELEGNTLNNEVTTPPITPPVQQTEAPVEQIENPSESNNWGFLFIVLLLAAVGVAAYYFLIMRKRHLQNNGTDDWDDDDLPEEYADTDVIQQQTSETPYEQQQRIETPTQQREKEYNQDTTDTTQQNKDD